MAQGVPPGAAALGYTNCVINERPTAADITSDTNGNYKWFDGGFWYTPPMPPLTAFSTVSNVLVLNYTGYNLDLVSLPLDFSTGALPLLAGSNGFYVEFDVRLSDNDLDHWPAVWLMPMEHNAYNSQYQATYNPIYGTTLLDHYSGDQAGFESWMELDVDEGGFGSGLTGTIISWTGISPHYLKVQNDANRINPTAIDQSQKHTFGASYDPVHQTLAWWVDGVYQMGAGSPDVPAIAAQQHFYLILSSYSHGKHLPYSMYVSGVRAYIGPPTILTPPTNLHATLQ